MWTTTAQFLFGEVAEKLVHDCVEVVKLQTKIREDLEEEELDKGEKWFVEGSSRVIEGKRKSRYAVVDGKMGKVIEAGPLNASWSAQACKLYAVLRALKGLKGKKGTIFTDLRYAFGMVQMFGKIWEERGLINTRGKGLTHGELICHILEALRGPAEIAVVHVKGHQTGIQFQTKGNNLADQEAKTAVLIVVSTPEIEGVETPDNPPQLSQKEIECYEKIGAKLKEGKWKSPDGRELVSRGFTRKILWKLHQKMHWGAQALAEQFLRFFGCKGIYELARQEVQGCLICQKVNKSRAKKAALGSHPIAYRRFERIQVDFTELPKVGRFKFVLVIVHKLTHWVEAFPSSRAMAQTVGRKLLEEIIPQYGVVNCIDSDQGTHFTSKVIKQMADALGIQWEYHTPWQPQSSGQVKRMNQTLKAQLSKLILETKMSWLKCRPLALLNIQTMPHSETGLSPFKMLYGMPYKHGMPVGHPRFEDGQIQPYLVAINRNLQELQKQGIVAQSAPLGFAIHKIQLGDKVFVKVWKEVPLSPHWEGPLLVLLTTDTAIWAAEKGWTHTSRVKKAELQEEAPKGRVTSSPGDLKIKLQCPCK